ncbi:MAG TPA: membrane dipeptidase [Tepidisphaeraceae bacterium]|nr:membrane dipeptidase [Tepidisphaeraceae bacterium]
MRIVDAHLDLAYNAVNGGRDVTRPAREQSAKDPTDTPSVGLPDLVAGNVGLVCATIFCDPQLGDCPGYRTADEAAAQARAQLEWYYRQFAEGSLEMVTTRDQVTAREPGKTGAILLMEGADPLRSADDVAEWFDAGLRIVGLAWRRTRMAGGTGEPGGLTEDGRTIVDALDRHGIVHDASHLAEQAFWELLDRSTGPVIASHSNCRAIVPTDRQLSDDMIKEIARRGGVIGINFYEKFLLRPGEFNVRRATLVDVVTHLKHICDLIGDATHVGLGTDMDGGFGAERIPTELKTSADLPRVAEALSAGGFSDADVTNIMGANWSRFFAQNLSDKT